MTTPQQITDAARAALSKLTIRKNITGREFSAARDAVRSSLALLKTDVTHDAEIVRALRAEIQAQINSNVAATLSGMVAVRDGKTRFAIRAGRVEALVSIPYSRAGTEAESIAACRAVLAAPMPDDDASELKHVQDAEKRRAASDLLEKLDEEHALECAVKRAENAERAVLAARIAADAKAARIAATAALLAA